MKEYILDHVLYEMEMFDYTIRKHNDLSILLKNSQMLNKSIIQMEWNSNYECLLLHARNLIDFFEDHPKMDDITISRVLLTVDGYNLGDTKKAHTFINKSVSHITRQRTKTNELHQWASGLKPVFSNLLSCEKKLIDELLQGDNIKEEIKNNMQNEKIRFRAERLQGAIATYFYKD